MSETKQDTYTPGPWMNHGQYVVTGSGEGPIDAKSEPDACRIVACVNACDGINPEAVPDLLEACKYFISLVETGITTESIKHAEKILTGRSVLRETKSAIAKAEGRE
jgi:hypothetical protein